MVLAPPRFVRSLFHRREVTRLAFVLFWPLLALWTWKLLEPNPVPKELDDVLTMSGVSKYVQAKCLHVAGNALLAGLSWVWAPPGRWRYAMLGFLLLHGVGTEIGQTFVPNRTGSVIDVLINWTGIALGTLVARWLTK